MGIVLLRRRVLRSCLGTKEILREGEMWRTDAQIVAQFFSYTFGNGRDLRKFDGDFLTNTLMLKFLVYFHLKPIIFEMTFSKLSL